MKYWRDIAETEIVKEDTNGFSVDGKCVFWHGDEAETAQRLLSRWAKYGVNKSYLYRVSIISALKNAITRLTEATDQLNNVVLCDKNEGSFFETVIKEHMEQIEKIRDNLKKYTDLNAY